MSGGSSTPRPAWEYLTGLLLAHRCRLTPVGGTQAARMNDAANTKAEVSAAGHTAAVQGTCGSGLPDRSARRRDVRLAARLSGSRRDPGPYPCRLPSASAVGGRAPLPWRLSRSVIDSVGPASAEFALPADLVRSAIACDESFAACRTSSSGWSARIRYSFSPAGRCPSARPSRTSRPRRSRR